MSTKDIEGLRERLFSVIDGVRDGTLGIDKAKTIGDLSQVIVNTAKVELDYVRATEGKSRFLDPALAHATALPKGITGITRHVLKG
jgi:hypothetical protein